MVEEKKGNMPLIISTCNHGLPVNEKTAKQLKNEKSPFEVWKEIVKRI